MKKDEIQGYAYILMGSTLWGISSVIAKSLFNIGLPPEELVLVRLSLATITLGFIFVLYNPSRLLISYKDLPYFILLGCIGVTGMQFTYYYTISKINVGPAILLQYLQPLWVSLYAFLFQKEPLSKMKIGALVSAILGCYLVVGGYQTDLLRLNKIGILSGLLASFFFTFYTLYGEKGLKKYSPWTLLFYGFGLATLIYLILVSPLRIIGGGHSLKIWMAFIYIAIFSTLLPFGFYFKGIERIRATRASIAATWEPVVAGFTAYMILGEILYAPQIIGGFGVIGAIILLQLAKEKTSFSTPIELRELHSKDEKVKKDLN
ncbi:MAG: DMT family transporter [Thermodesulfobacteriota bacterium]